MVDGEELFAQGVTVSLSAAVSAVPEKDRNHCTGHYSRPHANFSDGVALTVTDCDIVHEPEKMPFRNE